jgi:uncharacterized repeat protein (TIGR04042 family)
MPEMRFDVHWPDGKRTRCYSPSLIVCELIQSDSYPLFEFMERARAALNIGSERVRLKFGFYCSAAMDQLKELESLAKQYEPDAVVKVLGLHPDGGPKPPMKHENAAMTGEGS